MLHPTSRPAGWLSFVQIGLFVAPMAVLAQAPLAPLSGTVRTSAGAPIPYANLTLHRATDSVAIKSEFSDAEGRFQLKPTLAGRYLISAAQVGYQRQWLGPLDAAVAPGNPLHLVLPASPAAQLQGVTVTAQRPLFERLPDRTIVHVEGSPLSSGGTTLDVLNRAPGISLDANENLALRGQSGLLVLLNGKRIPMTGPELANLLRTLPAEQVANIELITNPPAKYEAQGSAGIISINLKKDQRLGTNGTVNAAYGRGRYGKFTSGLNLNHRTKKFHVYGSYAYADRQNFQDLTFSRTYLLNDLPQQFSAQLNTPRSHLQSHTWRAGADYSLSDRTTVGAMVSGLQSRLPSEGLNEATVLDAEHRLLARYSSVNQRNLLLPSTAANLTLRHLFPKDSLGTAELTADADVARYGITRTLRLDTHFEMPALEPLLLTGNQNGTLTIWSAKTDYVRPLQGGLRLEAGLKASEVSSDNDVVFERTSNSATQQVEGLTNRFRYTENINAAYASITRSRPQLTVTVGLRGEQTNAKGSQEIGNLSFQRHYVQLFPNLSVRRPLTPQHELAFSLSRRLNRPTYNQLNPFRSYVDATSYRTGNPTLWAETSTHAELTHTFRQKFSTALSYTRTNRPIVGVYLLDAENLVAATDVNLRTQEYYGLSLTAPLAPKPWWKLYANAEVFYIQFQGELGGSPAPKSRPGAIVSLNNSFTLGHGWSAELSGSYNSPERYAFQDLQAYGQAAAGIQKTLGAATFRLNAADIFYTTPLRATSRYQVLEETFRMAQDSRVVTASVSYRFGNEKVTNARKRTTAAEEEKRRALLGQ